MSWNRPDSLDDVDQRADALHLDLDGVSAGERPGDVVAMGTGALRGG